MKQAVAIAIALIVFSSANANPIVLTDGGPVTRIWVETIAERFAGCFGLVGPDNLFPNAQSLPAVSEMLASIEYPASPFIPNGTRYTLMIHGKSNSAYALRTGGLSGFTEYFGPVPIDTKCPTAHSTRPPTAMPLSSGKF